MAVGMLANVDRLLLRLVVFTVLTSITSAVNYQFIQLPSNIQLVSYSVEANISATSANDCAQLIKSTTVAVQYDPTAQRCISYTKLQGFNTQNKNGIYYLRMAGKCGNCASQKEAKKAILNYVYGNDACPDTFFTYDASSGYCVGAITDQQKTTTTNYWSNYASYTQGGYNNGTLLTMSRGIAAKALAVSCPFANSSAATFNGNWYCYTQFPTPTPTASYVLDNICGSWISGATLLKFIHPAEPGYLSFRNGATSYFGAYLPTGASGAANSYRYTDGSVIPAPYSNMWFPGKPIARQFIYIGNSIQLEDYDITRMTRIMCRNPTSAPA